MRSLQHGIYNINLYVRVRINKLTYKTAFLGVFRKKVKVTFKGVLQRVKELENTSYSYIWRGHRIIIYIFTNYRHSFVV